MVGGWGGCMQPPSHANPTYSLFPRPGRSPELREDLIAAFQQLALEMGIPADSIFILANRGNPRGMSLSHCLYPRHASALGQLLLGV